MNERKKFYLEGLITGIVLVIFFNAIFNVLIPNLGIFGPKSLTFEKKMNVIYSIIDNFYVEDYDKSEIEEGIYLGMVYGLGDRYSSYMDSATFQNFMEQTEGSYAGIGASVSRNDNGGVLIVNPYKGAPADLAGITAGDLITEVNGLDILNMDLDIVVSMMKGEPGTVVNLTLFRESEGKTFDVDVSRDIVDVPTVEFELLENNIGYIKLMAFERVTFNQFEQALDTLLAQGVEGLILDVRNNPGGLMDTVVKICNRLLPEGLIVYTENKNGEQDEYYSDADQLDIPLVVLVNGNSASASEVLSGAIKDHEAGILVGEQTFGKGVVQNVYPLTDGSAVKVTISRYYTPNGICIHGEGITPDYVEPMDDELTKHLADLSYDLDNQLQKAVEIMNERFGIQ